MSNWRVAADMILDRILSEEGGIRDVADGKGLTRFGQTPEWLATWSLPVPTTRSAAKENYRLWLLRTGLIALCDRDDALANLTIDWAVHSGHILPIKALQRSLQVTADGILGAKTKAALTTAQRSRIATQILAARLRLIGSIAANRPDYVARNWGWFNRLANQLELIGEDLV